tara:strand:+ start:193 stop:1032 length:840 start_codon:yes stop_codon:yes gene_type:complete
MKKNIYRFILIVIVTGIVLPCSVFADRQSTISHSNFLSHRAIYSLSMGVSDSPGHYIDVRGVVHASLERACDGWITSEQVKMQVFLQAGRKWDQNLMYSGWESHDGRKYRFAARSSSNGDAIKYRGNAYSNKYIAGEAKFIKPEQITMELPPETQFYFGLTSWLIKKARNGARRVETISFDGLDLDGPQKVVAFIVPIKSESAKFSSSFKKDFSYLVDKPGWKMHIAFYPLQGRQAAPDYEVQAIVMDNGVMPKLELVFDSFTAVQKLEKIELLKVPKC